MNEIKKLLNTFFQDNKSLVIITIIIEIIYPILETIVLPMILAKLFNHINNIKILRNELIKLVINWLVIKLTYSISLYYQKNLQVDISKFIYIYIINKVFNKYSKESKITNISVLLDKIHLIKTNIQDFIFLLCTKFIPRGIVLIANCLNILRINYNVGILLIFLTIIQIFILTRRFNSCIDLTIDEFNEKDIMYEYIEDILANISTIQSTTDGFDIEIDNLNKILDIVKNNEISAKNCVNKKQYIGYSINIIIFSVIIYYIYYLRKNDKINIEDTTTILLLLIGLFDNMSDIAYFFPDLTYKIGILNTNEQFLEELNTVENTKLDSSMDSYIDSSKLSSFNIKFRNVSFNYDNNIILNNYSIDIPENQIICIFGEIGVGKSTFIKLIYSIIKPDTGTITIGGEDNLIKMRKYISYIDQNSNKLFDRTLYDNITYGIDKKYKKENIINEIKNIITNFDLYDIFKNLDTNKEKWYFLEMNVGKLGKKLSGGQKQVIHMIRIMLNNISKIVILDEPTSHLDSNSKNSVLKLIQYLNLQGKTIIIVTHDETCKSICNKFIEFSKTANPVLYNNL